MRSILLVLIGTIVVAAADLDLTTVTWLGGLGDESASGCAYQPDGTLVVGGMLGASITGPVEAVVDGATPASPAAVVRLAPDGRTVQSVTRVGDELFDLAIGPDGRIHVAAGKDGYVILAPNGKPLKREAIGYVRRVDVGSDGTVAILVPTTAGQDSTPGAGTVHIYMPTGAKRASFAGHRNTLDLAVDAVDRLVVTIGWRQAKASDGKSARKEPVQIAYLRATDYDGQTRWTDYDWPTENDAANFLNASANNMADTRGYRVAIGGDGTIVAAFECAGGNHIFRWSPSDIHQATKVVGGDAFFSWSNTRSEHKTFIGRFAAATGAYLMGQQFCGRLANGKANAVRVKNGGIACDRAGRVYVVGAAADGLPLTSDPLPPKTYTGGGFVLVLSPGLDQRLLCTRLSASGTMQAVAVRPKADGFAIVGAAGEDLHVVHPLQTAFGGGKTDAAVAVFDAIATVPNAP